MSFVQYIFADFLVDDGEETLYKSGVPLKIQTRTFQILRLLLENAGNVVRKEDFFEKIWNGVFVEDNNLTVAIAQIRKVLGETSDKRFIETVPKKGYRFVAPVEKIYERDKAEETEFYPIETEKASPISEKESAKTENKFSTFFGSRKVLAAICLLLLIFISAAFWRHGLVRKSKAEPFRSIAVLPFSSATDTPNNQIFAEKLTQELIHNLGRVTDARVSSFESTAVYKSPEMTSKVSEELKTDGVITGKITSGEKEEMSVSLQDSRTGEIVFTKIYSLNTPDFADSQYRLARDIAAQIGTNASETKDKATTKNLEAYQNYLEGRYFLTKDSSKDFENAVNQFTEAALKDENFADAQSALATAHIKHGLALYGARGLSASRRSFPSAKEAALKALALEPNSDEAFAALAFVNYRHEYDWQSAEINFKKALEINPNNLQARRWFGEFLHRIGRFDEGFAEQQKALALDVNSAQILSEIAWGNYLARRFDEAENYTKKSLYIDKSNAATLYNLSEISEQKGNLKEAVELWKEAMVIEAAARRWIANIEQKYQTDGREGFTRAKAEWLEDLIGKDYVYPTDLAKCYAVLGENDKAIKWLEKGIEGKVPDLLSVKYAPAFDSLKTDARFQEILEKMRFPQ